MWKPWRSKYSAKARRQLRNPDGTFAVDDGAGDGDYQNNGSISRAARDQKILAEVQQQQFAMQEAYYRMMDQRNKTLREEAEAMAEQMVANSDDGDDLDGIIKSFLMAIAEKQQLGNKDITQSYYPSSPNPNNGGASVETPAPDPAKALNETLALIGKIPKKLFNETAVNEICKAKGIDQHLLRNVVNKLHGKV